MAVTTAYSEDGFLTWLHDLLLVQGVLAGYLGWDPDAGHYDQILEDTLLDLGVEAITEISGLAAVRRLRALGRVRLWETVLAALATDTDHTVDGGSFSLSQAVDQVERVLERARADALPYLDTYAADLVTVRDTVDPYQWADGDEWA